MSEQQEQHTSPQTSIPEWTVADRIRKARESSELDQTALAVVTGISRQTISNYERGITKPSKGNVKLIAMATGIDRYWLLHGLVPTPGNPGDQAGSSTEWETRSHLRAVAS